MSIGYTSVIDQFFNLKSRTMIIDYVSFREFVVRCEGKESYFSVVVCIPLVSPHYLYRAPTFHLSHMFSSPSLFPFPRLLFLFPCDRSFFHTVMENGALDYWKIAQPLSDNIMWGVVDRTVYKI